MHRVTHRCLWRAGAVALALLGALGCGQRPRCLTYHFGSSFPVDYEDAARVAVAKWSRFSGIAVTIDARAAPVSDVCAFRAAAVGSASYTQLAKEIGGDFAAMHREADGSITIVEEEWAADEYCTEDRVVCATSILMHELGHEWGMRHLADELAVMNATTAIPRMDYNESDRVEFKRAQAAAR